jgi:hypothetical protein
VSVEPPPAGDILALDEAFTRLAETAPEAARVVQLHFFAGLPIEQVAEMLGVSRATAYRQWPTPGPGSAPPSTGAGRLRSAFPEIP